MTMRLSLVIEGDGSGARKALEETAGGVEDLGRKAEDTARKVEGVSKGIEWNDTDFDAARNGLKSTGDEADKAASAVSSVAEAGARAAPEIAKVGDAADIAGGKFSGLGSVIIGAAGGLAATVAITAVGAALGIAAEAAGVFVHEIISNTPQIERDLKSHEDLIKRIKGAYAEAEGAASSYGLNSTALLRFQAQQDAARLSRDLEAALNDAQRGALHQAADPHGGTRVSGEEWERIAQFRQELRDGTADVIAFRNELAAIGEALPEGDAGRGLIEQILGQTETAAKLQAELERSRDLLDGLRGDADAAATALGGTADKYGVLSDGASTAGDAIGSGNAQIRDTGSAAAAALPALAEYDRLLKSIGGGSVLSSPAREAATPLLEGRTFASGGYTGHMPADRIAGFVHGREYVFDAETTARIGVGNLDAIRAGVRGYAAGGSVGALPMAGSASGASAAGSLAAEFRMLQGSVRQFGMTLAQTNSLGEALGSVLQSLSQRFLDFSLRALDQLLLGGSGGGFGLIGDLIGLGGGIGAGYFPPAPIGVGLYHGGGNVGLAPAVSRMVPPSVFIGAPRLHEGGWLKPGEKPIIAMEGEEVGWPDQLARKYGRGDTVINNFHVETPSPRAFAESRSTVARAAARLSARSGRFT